MDSAPGASGRHAAAGMKFRVGYDARNHRWRYGPIDPLRDRWKGHGRCHVGRAHEGKSGQATICNSTETGVPPAVVWRREAPRDTTETRQRNGSRLRAVPPPADRRWGRITGGLNSSTMKLHTFSSLLFLA